MLTPQIRSSDRVIKAGRFGRCGRMVIKAFEIPEKLKARCRREIYRNIATLSLSDCWEWTGRIHNGYPSINYPSGSTKWAHRVSYALFIGPIEAQRHIDHRCRNPRCVNPLHLKKTTPTENYLAKYRRKRLDIRKAQEAAGQLTLWNLI